MQEFDLVAGNLTADQTKAVSGVAGCHVISGPPGSGKTEVLVQRAIRVLREPGRQPYGVLALTSTTMAAANFRKRIENVLGRPDWRLCAETFHNFCLGILKEDGENSGQEPPLTVYESVEDRLIALERALAGAGLACSETDGGTSLRALLTEIDRLKADLVSPEDCPRTFVADVEIPVDIAYTAYERALTSLRAVDFSGLLFGAYHLVRDHPEIGKRIRALYQQVLVDDGQDMGRAQYEILRQVFGGGRSDALLACDPYQSIQGFSGANPQLVNRFAVEFQATTSRLNGNHRSAVSVNAVASRLARYLQDSEQIDLEPIRNRGRRQTLGSVEAWSFANPAAEAAGVAEWVEQLLEGGMEPSWLAPGERREVAPEEIGLLGRTWREVFGVFSELQNRNIPCVVRSGRAGLFSSRTGRCCHYALRVRANPHDVVSAYRFAALIPGIESVSGAWLRGDYEVDFNALLAAATGVKNGFPSEVAGILEALTGPSMMLPELVGELATATVSPANEPLPAVWALDQQQLARSWRVFALSSSSDERSLLAFLSSMSRGERGPVEGPGIRVSTVHSTKGLEFRAVAVLGLSEGGFPHHRSLESAEQVDSERRTAYVAVTRASRVLRVTRALTAPTAAGFESAEPSRFLAEMGLPVIAR